MQPSGTPDDSAHGYFEIAATPDFEWSDYFAAVDTKGVHPLYAHLDPYLSAGMAALDLGCGVGHGTLHLCERGLGVTAVDISDDALNRLRRRVSEKCTPTLICADFARLSFPTDAFDVVTATNALYFLPPHAFVEFWPKLTSWIRSGGVFIGQFMGPRDAWAHREDYSVHSSDEVRCLFTGFELLYFHDDERDSVNILGKLSRVHVVHFLARKL